MIKTTMNYKKAKEWIIREDAFDSTNLGKCEAIMCLGNGYLGLRSATEEKYLGEKRNYFVAGTFNKFDEDEVTELPNAADILAMEIMINGEYFSLEKGNCKEYYRELCLKTGELHRHILWVSPKGEEIEFDFYRVVSLKNLHLIAQKVLITPHNREIEWKIFSGIDGRMTNSGSQHFSDGNKRLYEKKYMQFIQTTEQTKIDFIHNTSLSFWKEEREEEVNSRIVMDRRKIFSEYNGKLLPKETLTIEKISNVYTSRDKDAQGLERKVLQEKSLEALKESVRQGYNKIAKESSDYWKEKVWDKTPIIIQSEDEFDQLAIRFAQYHLEIMTPDHDNRMNIGAKGLSGEGYKGHTFWDMDIFVLPYYIFTNPDIARKLVEYRYLSLPGAHKKAAGNQFEGAQFPWESAWLDDGEVTPVWGAADIITGLPTKIWSGFIEQHITADVAYAVWQYYMVTKDEEFMDKYGYELLLDTAKFWVSRLEYSEEDKKYHINDVVGPDEYKEHADDNAFTNYMAYWNIGKAMEYFQLLKTQKSDIFQELNEKMDLERFYKEWEDKKEKIYLPQPREKDLVIAQDKKYLTLKEIDLTQYKNQEQVGSLFLDYNLEQVNQMQVSKQADIMILFFLMENLFSLEVKKANWNYYEPKTLHDSSLSLSTHCILATDMGDYDMAYHLFQRASHIDLGENMKSSNDGIHSASIGGIWQCIVYGFGGVRMLNGELRIEPKLPEKWSSLSFEILWHGQRLQISVDKKQLIVKNQTKKEGINFKNKDNLYNVDDEIRINLVE